ncbi:MAG: ShlB/FhaC/HecB family hemolysin secretion/activation protein [Rhizomicrobium sp.]
MRARSYLRNGSAFIAALSMAFAVASAEDFDRIAPKTPKPSPPVQLSAPAVEPKAATASAKPVLAELRGLRFVSRAADVVKTGAHDEGIAVASDDLAPLVDSDISQRLARDFLGKPLSLADLDAIAQAVKAWYRAHSLPLVDVTFPEQDISTGTVQAVVTIYRLGQVHVRDNGRFSQGQILQEMQLKPGDPLDFDRLRADLNRLGRNPFHPVDVVLAKGTAPGQTDLDLDLHARFPLRVYLSYDNDGEAVTGRERYSAGINLGNLFGLDEQLSYQFMTSPDLWRDRHRGPGLSNDPRFTAHSLTFISPLPWGDYVNVFAAYSQMVPDLGPYFGQRGHDLEIGAHYIHDLLPIGALSHQLTLGFDFKRTDNNLAYGGVAVSAHSVNVEQFSLTYNASRPDDWGQTALENTLVVSPGGLSDGNTTSAFLAYGTVGAHAGYAYDRLDLSRVNVLTHGFSAYAHFEGQIASTELLPSEQIGAGGIDSVRGYDPRKVNGSNGAVGSIELRSPSISLLSMVLPRARDQLQLLAFYDAGWVAYRNDQPYQPRNASLQSAGVGARYTISRFIDARFDDGWQLQKAPGATSLGNLATVSVTLSY